MQEEQKTQCPECGAFNFGIQTSCLVCHAELTVESPPEQPPAKETLLLCKNCGEPLKVGKSFCTQCGTKREAEEETN